MYLALAPTLPTSWRIIFLVVDVALVATPFFLIPGRAKYLLVIPLAALAPLEVLQISLMGIPSTFGILGSVMDTNAREASEFILGTLPWSLVTMAFSAFSVWCAIQALRKKPARLNNIQSMAVVGAILCALALQGVHLGKESSDFESARDLAHFELLRTYPWGILKKAQELTKERLRLKHRADRIGDFDWRFTDTIASDSTRQTLVVVLGESSRRGSWGLYGYARETSPRLATDSELIVFPNAVSNANMTRESIPQLMGLVLPTHPGLFDSTPSILQCFQRKGFRTSWLSNQGAYGTFSAKPTMIGHEAEDFLFLGADLANESKNGFDSILLGLMSRRLAEPSPRKLIVLHTMGSHFNYKKRYPSEFAKFLTSQTGELDTGAYDNSILYTDWLLAAIRDTLKTRHEPSAMLFVSDHGEAIGEDCGHGTSFIHGCEFPCAVEYEVPLFVWLSQAMNTSRPGLSRNLRDNSSKRVSTTDVPTTLLAIAGIESGRLSQDHNLAGSRFVEHPRDLITPSGKIIALDDPTLRKK